MSEHETEQEGARSDGDDDHRQDDDVRQDDKPRHEGDAPAPEHGSGGGAV